MKENIVGKNCNYYDLLGEPRIGKVVNCEIYNRDFPILLCYIQDELNYDLNNKTEIIEGILTTYAEIRNIDDIEIVE